MRLRQESADCLMVIFYLNNKNREQARIIRTLFKSYTGEKVIQASSRFEETIPLLNRVKFVVFAGILRGDGLIYKYCRDNKINFFYVDHAYLLRGYNHVNSDDEWMRITYNSFTWNLNRLESVDRWNEHFANKFPISPWNKNNGKNILVLPPSLATQNLFPESLDWLNNVMKKIKNRTDAPIIIREKPTQVKIDPDTNMVLDHIKTIHDKTVEQEIENAKLIVTFNSAVPVLGLIRGVPCYCSAYAAAYPMNISLNYINNPPEPDRQAWLQQLVYHQYRGSEIKSGKVWPLLEKYTK